MLLLRPCQATVADLKEAACAAHKLEEVDVQLWDHYQDGYYGDEPLDARPDATLSQAQILDKQPVMLLEKVRRACATLPSSCQCGFSPFLVSILLVLPHIVLAGTLGAGAGSCPVSAAAQVGAARVKRLLVRAALAAVL